MRTMQGSFGRLRVPLPINSIAEWQELLELCVRLYNVRATMVGLSQIRNVYMPVWMASDDDRMWDDIGNVMFGEIRRRDRISRFHLEVVEAPA